MLHIKVLSPCRRKQRRNRSITLQNSFCMFDACTPMTKTEILAMGKKPKIPAPPLLMIMMVRGGAFCEHKCRMFDKLC